MPDMVLCREPKNLVLHLENNDLIDRRSFLAHSFSATALIGASSAAQAQTYVGVNDIAIDRFAQKLCSSMSDAQYQTACARVVQTGWAEHALPPLHILKAQIADDHRTGATQLVNGMRFSDTEITWSVAYLARQTAA